ncbi:TetR/AcrR family transcriptional regulator [candidate division WOR-3 bacterium]|nr:TetR/AcrR family transcriptional regulator [candidate division WOR-3 bacterium]
MGHKMTGQLKRKEREREVRKLAILEAAKKVFAEHGFDAAKMDDIARMAEFSKGTIYSYFKNKDDLFLSLIEKGLDELSMITKSVVESSISPIEKIKKEIQKILEYAEKNRDFFCIFTPERGGFTRKRHPEIKKRVIPKYQEGVNFIAKIMEEGVRTGVLKKIEPIVLSRILLGLISSTIGEWIMRKEKEPLKQTAKITTTIFLEGARARTVSSG